MPFQQEPPEGAGGRADAFIFLELGCQRVAEHLGKPDITTWNNADFARLSEEIFARSRVQVSSNTLKRIFGRIHTTERYYPQQATRDALAQYIGFTDWKAFVTDVTPSLHPSGEAHNPDVPLRPGRPRRSRWVLPALLLFSGVAGVFLVKSLLPEPKSGVPFRITCRNPFGRAPHSAIFDLHVTDPERMRDGEYTLQFGDGKRKKLDPNWTFYSHYYEQPGRFLAVVERNGTEVADTIPVYLPTKGWTATIQQAHDSLRLYSAKLPAKIQQLKLTTNDVRKTGVDTTDIFTVKFINAYETGISGDNFELETNVTASPEYAAHRCSQVRLWLFGRKTRHVIQITRSGCQHWGYRNISEKQTWGQSGDMSYLTSDLQQGGTLKLVVRDKHMSFFINGRKSFDETYSFPLEQIYSVRIDFIGAGSVNSFRLKDVKTGTLFAGNF